jgi:ABC-2 type transport system permease protein
MLSDWRLGIPTLLIFDHQMTSLLLCLGLSGIGVGLGARLPLVTEQSPSRIAAGFGGTLNLVVSTLFIVLVLTLTALPCHVYIAQQHDPNLPPAFNYTMDLLTKPLAIGHWLVLGTIASIVVSLLAAFLPMWIGIRTFRRQEFR